MARTSLIKEHKICSYIQVNPLNDFVNPSPCAAAQGEGSIKKSRA